jgi:predicted site-specific integrase-resolvase
MRMEPREWVSLKEAAEQIGVNITTIREWYRSGAVDSRGQSPGVVVDLEQV